MGVLEQLWSQRMAKLTGRHISTCRRWLRTDQVPSWVQRIERFARDDLADLDPAWSGWVIRHGKLWSPEGWAFTPAQLYALPWLRQQVQVYQQQLWTHRQVDWIEGRYVDSAPVRAAGFGE